MSTTAKPIATWRKVLAAIFDFLTVFFVGGYVIGHVTGNLSDDGFKLEGVPALVLFAIIVAYFAISAASSAAPCGSVCSARGEPRQRIAGRLFRPSVRSATCPAAGRSLSSMIPKSGHRFSEKIMLQQARAG